MGKEAAAMSSEAFEIVAMLMRYVFAVIGLLIVWRSFRWLRRDAKAYRREMRALPDAGLVGEMVNLMTGEAQPLPREGTIGSSRGCDICVKGEGIQRVHARFEFEAGKGLRILPVRRSQMLVGGIPLSGAGYALHGTQLQVGNTVLRVRLFAGLDVPHPAMYQEPDEVWDADVALPLWREEEQELNPLPPVPYLPPDQDREDTPPYERAFMPSDANRYDGNYTEDGQMTWQYAYSLDELRAGMEQQQWQQMQPPEGAPDEEGVPYTSPVPRRRRRERHEK